MSFEFEANLSIVVCVRSGLEGSEFEYLNFSSQLASDLGFLQKFIYDLIVA